MKKKDIQLIWDFDDTIVHTSVEFGKTNQDTAELIAKNVFGELVLINEIKAFQVEADLEMVKKYGFVPPRYLMSWFATYEHFASTTGSSVQDFVKAQIENIINDLYIREYENVNNSIAVIKKLHDEGYSMIVLTAGQDDIQLRKVKESGVFDFMKEVFVFPYKTPEVFKLIQEKYPAEHHVMIGNSLKSDIHPALENNAWGFHVEKDTWEADHHDIDKSNDKYVHVGSLSEIPSKLEEILQASSVVAV